MKKVIFTLALLFFAYAGYSQSIAGYATLILSKPVTPDQKVVQRELAQDSLAGSIDKWLSLFFPEAFVKNDKLSKYFKNEFIESCLKHAEEYSVVRGHTWTVEYSVKDNVVDSILAARNKNYDEMAFKNRALAKAAYESNDISAVYNKGVKALFASIAHIGSPLEAPDGTIISEEMSKMVQEILDRVVITYNPPVIIGSPPLHPDKSIEVQAQTDSIFMGDFSISGHLANGRKIITTTTNKIGSAHLNEMKIPFVRNSTFLYVRPDFGKVVGAKIYIDAEDLGLKHSQETDQTLIFKIKKARYTLHYKLIPTGISDIPDIFRDDKSIRTFLNDSLPFEAVATGAPTDLLFDISNRVVSVTDEQKASRTITTEATITINNLRSGKDKIMRSVKLKEQEFDTSHPIPSGLYFWDCIKALRIEIRKLLQELQEI